MDNFWDRLDKREFDYGEVRLVVFRRFDLGGAGIRSCGTKEGTRRGKVVFDEHDLKGLVGARLATEEPDDAELGRVLGYLYDNAKQLGAKSISPEPDYRLPSN